jgi:hypothetical protein
LKVISVTARPIATTIATENQPPAVATSRRLGSRRGVDMMDRAFQARP